MDYEKGTDPPEPSDFDEDMEAWLESTGILEPLSEEELNDFENQEK